VTVYAAGTENATRLYTDQTRDSAADNPVNTDGFGNISFFAEPGFYDLSYAVGGDPMIERVQVLPYYSALGNLPHVKNPNPIWGELPTTPHWTWQSGVYLGTSDSNGFVVVHYPTAFANAIIALNVDAGQYPTHIVPGGSNLGTPDNPFVSLDGLGSGLSSFRAICLYVDGANTWNSMPVRLNWSALGC
jgi:hypothetical protein